MQCARRVTGAKADAGSRDGSHGRTGRYSAARRAGTDARVGRWYLRRGSRRGRMRGTPRYSECDARPATRVPRRSRKVDTLHACRAGVPRVQRGLTCNGTRNVATRSAQRTCTMAAGRSEVFRTVPLPSCSSGQIRNDTWGAPGNNTRIRAAARNKSGRRTPPLRAVSRAASPFPPTVFK